ncbi:MAG: hypothetical protein M9945_05115 [Aquamicrobium sp.]|uniref:hypothetical protein n=1 Tax=Aquamicrobium sp. TaxID=1872579 RepID=UPI00349E8165|nr:hypothetical protein [Aquamicrobium sp.]
MSTALVPIETLGAEIKARVEAGDKALDKAEQHYIAAGIQLAEAKRRLEQTKEMAWPAFLHAHCAIRRRRADDLIAIGQGRITLAEHREKNRERVAAHRERKRAAPALRNAENNVSELPPPIRAGQEEDLRAIIARQAKEIEALKRQLAKAEETIAEKEAQRRAQEGLAASMSRAAHDQSNRAMFAEADKERLADELAALRNADEYQSGLERAEEMLLGEYYGVAETWLQRLGTDEDHPAYRHRIEAHNSFVTEDIGFLDILMMIQHEAFGRLNDYFSSSCTYNGLPEQGVREPKWRSHARTLAERGHVTGTNNQEPAKGLAA